MRKRRRQRRCNRGRERIRGKERYRKLLVRDRERGDRCTGEKRNVQDGGSRSGVRDRLTAKRTEKKETARAIYKERGRERNKDATHCAKNLSRRDTGNYRHTESDREAYNYRGRSTRKEFIRKTRQKKKEKLKYETLTGTGSPMCTLALDCILWGL